MSTIHFNANQRYLFPRPFPEADKAPTDKPSPVGPRDAFHQEADDFLKELATVLKKSIDDFLARFKDQRGRYVDNKANAEALVGLFLEAGPSLVDAMRLLNLVKDSPFAHLQLANRLADSLRYPEKRVAELVDQAEELFREQFAVKINSNPGIDEVRQLLTFGKALGVADIIGGKALMCAEVMRSVPLVRLLIENGAKTQATSWGHWRPLHYAAQVGSVEVARLLIENGGNTHTMRMGDKDSPDWERYTPLHFAARRGYADLVRLLIENGAPLNASYEGTNYRDRIDRTGPTPLYSAVESGSVEVVKLLLEKGSDPKNEVYNPLNLAAEKGSLDLVKALLEGGAHLAKSGPLHWAVKGGSLKMVRFLLELGADPNALAYFYEEDSWGPTLWASDHDYYKGAPIHLAIRKGSLAMVQLLIENGADPKMQVSYRGQGGPIQPAIYDKHEDALDLALNLKNQSIVDYLKKIMK